MYCRSSTTRESGVLRGHPARVEVAITRVEAKGKLGRNRPAADVDGVVAGPRATKPPPPWSTEHADRWSSRYSSALRLRPFDRSTTTASRVRRRN
ncbi:hypothetical protein [Saccharothrix texasensis]|uniref:hypothetical protein n=1 Tax=Saccharothrix texasensis TaxID=103734 RepID=UPI001B874C65|nr:hypothetical protein [Saccharothrix texasensis]